MEENEEEEVVGEVTFNVVNFVVIDDEHVRSAVSMYSESFPRLRGPFADLTEVSF